MQLEEQGDNLHLQSGDWAEGIIYSQWNMKVL